MTTVKAVLNRDREKKSGGYSLVIQLLHRRVKRVVYTSYTLMDNEFDAVTEKALYRKGGRFTAKQIKEVNLCVDKLKREMKHLITLVSSHKEIFEADDVIREYKQEQSNRCLAIFIERLVDKKMMVGKFGIAKAFRSTLHSINKFTKNRVVIFDDITHVFVRKYMDYLLETGVQHNTMNFYLRNFRSIYNLALEQNANMVDNTPFHRVIIRHEKTNKRALKKEIIDKIVKLDLSDHKELEMARDLFMFSFYARGMCFVDMVYLTRKDINDGVIYYRRHKTFQYMQVTIIPALQVIIDKYRSDDLYVLPLICGNDDSSVYKRYQLAYGMLYHSLKKLAKLLGLTTPLTMHVARHSWATIAKESGAKTSAISQGLGHSSEKTTAIYLKDFDNSVIDAVNSQVVHFTVYS